MRQAEVPDSCDMQLTQGLPVSACSMAALIHVSDHAHISYSDAIAFCCSSSCALQLLSRRQSLRPETALSYFV